MALGTDLESDIEDIDGGDSVEDASDQWANDAMDPYAVGVVPVLAAGVMAGASAALEASLVGVFGNTVVATTTTQMELAFTTFAATMAAGMAPAFVGTPPPAPVGFSALLTTNQPSKAVASAAWASAIEAWMITGTAVPSGGGSPVNWS